AYFAGTDRATQARDALASLRKDYPDSLNALRLEIRLLGMARAADSKVAQTGTAPGAGTVTTEADERIKQFLSNNPGEFAARLFWVEWLNATGRTAQAAAYLDDSGNFPGGSTDLRYQRLRAVLLRKTDANSTDVVQAEARDPVVDAALIQAAATLEEKQRQVAE